MAHTVKIGLMDLPIEMVDKILSYMSYDQIAKVRPVNRTFNNICSNRLNNGFIALEKFHTKCMKTVKSKLPRRESERKHHPLARHCDILTAVETRLSMLSMTFTKYIERHHCCFIPGKVLDEGFRVLRIVNNCSWPSSTNLQYPNLPRPYEFLQEYRDISSMAMEHFDDKILPSIREKMRLENPRLYSYKNKLISRPQLLVNKINVLQSNSSSEKCNISCSAQGHSSQNGKGGTEMQKLVQVVHNKVAKCNSTHKAVIALHQKTTLETKKLRLENMILKRKCNQLSAVTALLRKDLAESKNVVSALTKDLNQLKSEQSSSNVESSRSDLATNPAMKLYKLLRLTDVKCNSTRKAVVSLHRHMNIMAKKIKAQEISMRKRQKCSSRIAIKQRKFQVNSSSTVPNKCANQLKSSRDVMEVEDS